MPRDRSRSPTRTRRSRDDDDESSRHGRRRDRSPRDRHRSSRTERNEDDEPERQQTVGSLKEVGQEEISLDDYFLKSAEFRAWMREVKNKYVDELSGEASRKYFAKFVKRWNNLTLPVEYYRPHASTSSSASSQTAYKWSFANNRSKVDKTELAKLRQDVDAMTNGRNDSHSRPQQGPSRPPPPSSSSGRQIGPIMPISTAFSANHADRQLALETRREDAARERKAERNKLLGRAEDMVPKSSGREGKMDEKRAINAENRKYREKDASAGMEMDESTLMGGGSDFQQALAQREAANARRQERRAHTDMDRRSGMSERLQTMKAKDDQTMAMFRQLAQSKFGGQ